LHGFFVNKGDAREPKLLIKRQTSSELLFTNSEVLFGLLNLEG